MSVLRARARAMHLEYGARPRRPRLAVVLTVLLIGGCAASWAQARPRILVTNDDGYESPGLRTLVAELAAFADVVVSAPDDNQSGSSQSIGSLGGALEVERVEIPGAAVAYAISGTPAMASTFGLLELGREKPFDLLVSGINQGANVGEVSHLSGTVGAAMQGIFLGVPSIAVSQDSGSRDFAVAAAYTTKLIKAVLDAGMPQGVMLSVNVPAEAIQAGGGSVEVLPMGGSYLSFQGFSKSREEGPRSYWNPQIALNFEVENGSDTAAYLGGSITVTPLRFDWTDHDSLGALREVVPQP